MVNRREKVVSDAYENDGWRPVRCGWPDWLMIDVDEDGEITDMKAVEVKSPDGRLRHEQQVVKQALEQLGMNYEVEVVE